jgi:hypothetical protein
MRLTPASRVTLAKARSGERWPHRAFVARSENDLTEPHPQIWIEMRDRVGLTHAPIDCSVNRPDDEAMPTFISR